MSFMANRHLVHITTPFYQGLARTWPFYSHKNNRIGHTFSNLFPCTVQIDSALILPHTENEALLMNPDGIITFASTEHIFQCAKALYARDDLFCRQLSTGDVARCGQGRLKLSSKLRSLYQDMGGEIYASGSGKKKRWYIAPAKRYARRHNWEKIKLAVMWLALKAKFTQHPYLWQERIDDTEHSYLIEHTSNDKQWGDAGDGAGYNFLGKLLSVLLMEIRTGESIDIFSESIQEWLYTSNLESCSDFYQKIDDPLTTFRTVLYERMRMHPNDPTLNHVLQELTDIVAINETVVQKVFDGLNRDEMSYASEIFEDVSRALQSSALLSYFDSLQKKYPQINMESDLLYAKKAMQT